jgi:hypothetical protein
MRKASRPEFMSDLVNVANSVRPRNFIFGSVVAASAIRAGHAEPLAAWQKAARTPLCLINRLTHV